MGIHADCLLETIPSLTLLQSNARDLPGTLLAGFSQCAAKNHSSNVTSIDKRKSST